MKELIRAGQENNIPELESRVTWVVADYTDTGRLADLLQGVDTVLSFIVVAQDKGNQSQRNLIDACVKAGVRRFAPSDWAGFVFATLSLCLRLYSLTLHLHFAGHRRMAFRGMQVRLQSSSI